MKHPTALVETEHIGESTNVWAYAHVMSGARIGCNVNIGDHAFIEGGATIGNNVTIKNRVCVWEGITIEDDVFVGPGVMFTNDKCPRSPRMPKVHARYASRDHWLVTTLVKRGVSIGAAAVILPGVELGEFCMVGAGAIVSRNVEPYSLVVGTPAKKIADVCGCGQRLAGSHRVTSCLACGETPADRQP